ncbi:Lysine histidine transporter-like 8 [Dichanthelium oligosanthes]|uniref:Lysine histidine transporter-like 8 n=1 Tax=Dichanthelium oligosanthes TaxID=888268 RepID=A0A1E5ULY6_9POAL|nr:Lysine histidine transporter-like 8 [Dichanthelium oligosanthes]
MAMAMAAEGAASEPELVSIPATPRGLSTPDGAATPTGAGGGGRSKGAVGTPGRRVVEGLRGYLEDVGHLTRLDPRDAWLPVTESRGGNARYAAFHSLNAGLGFQALLLPLSFPGLGWSGRVNVVGLAGHSSFPRLLPGTEMPPGGMLAALYAFHSHDTPRGLLATTCLLVVLNCLSSFQIYSMPVFDSFEAYYTGRTNRPCSPWVRSGFRIFYGFLSLFISVALPFLSSLAGLLGGLTLPVTFAYPCFMWIRVKKPERFSFSWYLNWGLGLLGTAFSLAFLLGGVWSIVSNGMKLKFFKPN